MYGWFDLNHFSWAGSDLSGSPVIRWSVVNKLCQEAQAAHPNVRWPFGCTKLLLPGQALNRSEMANLHSAPVPRSVFVNVILEVWRYRLSYETPRTHPV